MKLTPFLTTYLITFCLILLKLLQRSTSSAFHEKEAESIIEFSEVTQSSRITSIIAVFTDILFQSCVSKCLLYITCMSINYNQLQQNCQLSNNIKSETNMFVESNWTHYQRKEKTFSHKNNGKYVSERISNCNIIPSIYFPSVSMEQNIYNKPINTSDITACTWFRINYDKQTHALLLLSGVRDGCNVFALRIYNGAVMIVTLNDRFSFDYGIKSNVNYHLCVLRRSDDYSLFIDGKFQQKIVRVTQRGVSQLVVLGVDLDANNNGTCVKTDTSQSFVGFIANLNVWKRDLNEAEIKNVYYGIITKHDVIADWSFFMNFNESEKVRKSYLDIKN